MSDILDMLSSGATHHAAEHAFTEAGWRPCGAGDWAIENRDESVAELVEIVRRIHEHALRELPWCGPGMPRRGRRRSPRTSHEGARRSSSPKRSSRWKKTLLSCSGGPR